ncbi:hypothetical protein [Kordia jejudonensis]|uniref:hypothetical protein n=1 Tax=Kordia jejudonensis TaxID=1348245 RepID=UPI000629298E|nr:hypothetical protein [Kordia jejudonensis]
MKKNKLRQLSLNKKVVSKLDLLHQKGGNIDNSFNECIRTLDVDGVNVCFETRQKNCGISVVRTCVTQTEFPTCRDCV